MKFNATLLAIFVIGSLLLSACGTGAIAANGWPGVAAGGDLVYTAYSTGVFAVRPADGQMAWRFPEKADNAKTFFATPALAGNLLVVGDYANTLYALDAASGAEKWTFKEAKGRWIGGALAVGETILAPNGDHTLYALDLNGKLLWKFPTGQALWSQPVSDGETVYLASMDHNLYALDLKTGAKKWSQDLGGALVYSPALLDKVLYVGTLANEMVAVQDTGSDGKIIWRQKTDKAIWATPTLHEGVAVFGDLGGTVRGLNLADGSEKFKFEAEAPVSGNATLLSDGYMLVTEAGDAIKLSFDGKKLWPHTVGPKLYTSPLAIGERVVIAISQGEKLLVALESNGNEAWTFTVPK